LAALLTTTLLIHGCGGGGGDATTTTTTTTTATVTNTTTTTNKSVVQPLYCKTNLFMDSNLKKMEIKGMAMDDTTMSECSDKILGLWPNIHNQPVKSLRLFAAWKSKWGDDTKRKKAWAHFLDFVTTNDIQVFLGVDTTADGFSGDQENEKQWNWGLDMMKQLGTSQVMGFSFGNEMLNKQGIDWDGKMWPWVQEKIGIMDAAGFGDVRVTLVWSMAVIPRVRAQNFNFLKQMQQTYTKRFVWVVNPYSIWDGSLKPTSSGACQTQTNIALSVAYLKNSMSAFREAVNKFTGNTDDPLWIGETGWASPFVASQSNVKSVCPYWGSLDALKQYYQMFLEWDGSLNSGLTAPEFMFYFTNRDAYDFGDAQPFGLVDKCSDPMCKLQRNETQDVVV
jgi:hypothetical protein